MSKARELFDVSIRDAEELLAHFNSQPKPPPDNAEVLKRAGMVMALTAWETFVEDLVNEEVSRSLEIIGQSHSGKFMREKLTEELKRFHNPKSDKTRKLFKDYVGVDVTEHWKWPGYDHVAAKKKLDDLIDIRGEIVHRSKQPYSGGPPKAHLVTKEALEKAIRFLKSLVEVTDKAICERPASA